MAHFENVFTSEECDNLIKHISETQNLEYVGTYNTITGENYIDLNFNKRKAARFKDSSLDIFKEKLLELVKWWKKTSVSNPDIKFKYSRDFISTCFSI